MTYGPKENIMSKFSEKASLSDVELLLQSVADLEKDQKIDTELTIQYCRKAVRAAEADVASSEICFVRGQASASTVLTARDKLVKATKALEQAEAFLKEFFD